MLVWKAMPGEMIAGERELAEVSGISRVTVRKVLSQLVAEGLPVLPVYLSSSVRMRESHQASQPLVHYDPRHKLTQQFIELHDFLDQNA